MGILVDDVNGLAAGERASGAAIVNEFTDNVLIRGAAVMLFVRSQAADLRLKGPTTAPVAPQP